MYPVVVLVSSWVFVVYWKGGYFMVVYDVSFLYEVGRDQVMDVVVVVVVSGVVQWVRLLACDLDLIEVEAEVRIVF